MLTCPNKTPALQAKKYTHNKYLAFSKCSKQGRHVESHLCACAKFILVVTTLCMLHVGSKFLEHFCEFLWMLQANHDAIGSTVIIVRNHCRFWQWWSGFGVKAERLNVPSTEEQNQFNCRYFLPLPLDRKPSDAYWKIQSNSPVTSAVYTLEVQCLVVII